MATPRRRMAMAQPEEALPELTKQQVELVNEGAAIDEQITGLTLRFDAIKVALKGLKPGTYVTKAGNHVKVTEVDKKADADPKETRELFKEKKLANRFYDVIKVSATDLAKYLSEVEIGKLRPKIGTIRKYSWK